MWGSSNKHERSVALQLPVTGIMTWPIQPMLQCYTPTSYLYLNMCVNRSRDAIQSRSNPIVSSLFIVLCSVYLELTNSLAKFYWLWIFFPEIIM